MIRALRRRRVRRARELCDRGHVEPWELAAWDFAGVTIAENRLLPPATIVVSSDLISAFQGAKNFDEEQVR